MEGQASTFISAAPGSVYALVSDITRMGEWSPETTKCEWVDDKRGVGAAFVGQNKLGPFKWSTTPTVTAADPGHAFAFSAGPTEWRYEFTALNGGTQLTESFKVGLMGLRANVAKLVGRPAALERGMKKTIERIKAAAES